MSWPVIRGGAWNDSAGSCRLRSASSATRIAERRQGIPRGAGLQSALISTAGGRGGPVLVPVAFFFWWGGVR